MGGLFVGANLVFAQNVFNREGTQRTRRTDLKKRKEEMGTTEITENTEPVTGNFRN